MVGCMIIPTGIECKIGGHAGDANPVAKLLASCCDKLILHPNVVNASDINEMPKNSLYVEGSMLNRFLRREIELKEIKQNKILILANSPITPNTINAVNAAAVTIGIDFEIVELKTPLEMTGFIEKGIATGVVTGIKELVEQILCYKYDAIAVHTPIKIDKEVEINYLQYGGVNPWGGVEAIVSRLISNALNVPVAHAPLDNEEFDPDINKLLKQIVNPRIAPEVISNCFLHCVLKGLNQAPRIGKGISKIDFLVTPDNCWGSPHMACYDRNVPIIVVKENTTCLSNIMPDYCIFVENYWEAAGIIMCINSGITPKSVRD